MQRWVRLVLLGVAALTGLVTLVLLVYGQLLAALLWGLVAVAAFVVSRASPDDEEAQRRAAARAASRPAPPPVPDAAALADLKEPVTACPECGFVGIRMAGIQEGAWPGGGSMMKVVCPRCDYVGLPLEFAKREDYAAFLAELAG